MKYDLKNKLKHYSPHWVRILSEKAGVSTNQVRAVFSGGHKDKHGILMYAEELLNAVGER